MSKKVKNNPKVLDIIKQLDETNDAWLHFTMVIDPCLIDEDEQIIEKIDRLLIGSIKELKQLAGCPA